MFRDTVRDPVRKPSPKLLKAPRRSFGGDLSQENIQPAKLIAQGSRGLRLISPSQWNIREQRHGIRKTIQDSPSHAKLIGELKKSSRVQKLREEHARMIATANPRAAPPISSAPLMQPSPAPAGQRAASPMPSCPLDGGAGSTAIVDTPVQPPLFSPSGFGSGDYRGRCVSAQSLLKASANALL